MPTVTELRPKTETVSGTSAVAPAASVRQVAHVYREFLTELRREVRYGAMRPLFDGDEDATGVDFAFAVEVKGEDFERAVTLSSELEAKFFTEFGVNFLIVPEVM